MSEKKRYYWIKLKESFMTSDAVDFLMSQPDGANYVVLYQMLCLKTINTGGKLERHIGEVIIPYDEAKIQRDTKYFTIDTVRVALTLYKSLGLIYVDNNGTLCLTDHENLVGSETSWAIQKRNQRTQKLEAAEGGQIPPECPPIVQESVRLDIDIRDRDKSIEKDKEIEKEDTPLKGGMGGNEKDEKKPSKKTDYGKEEFEKDLSVLSKPMADSVVEWLKYKKQRREAYKPVSIKKLITQVKGYAEQYGEEAVMTVISDSIANGYMGVAFASIKGKKPNGWSGSRTANYDYSDTEGAL